MKQKRATSFFMELTTRPKLAVALTLLFIIVTASGLSHIVKDTSVHAFIPPDHPSLYSDALAEEVFGLSDSLVIALVFDGGGTVFTPERLALIRELTERVSAMPNIRSDRVASLATESSIRGQDGGVEVDAYVPLGTISTHSAADSAERFRQMLPHQSTLVSADGQAAIIVAELEDDTRSSDTYETVLAMAQAYEQDDLSVHVAGPGAVSGFLSTYIDRDARKMQPLVFGLVLLFIYLAFRSRSAMPGPLLVVMGAVGGAMGIMAWMDVPYYAITNALPVVLVAVSVADSIHILTAFYQRRALDPEASTRYLVVDAMDDIWRPITLTTVTTIAGFVGIALMSIMPPVIMFGWIAALGVGLAWVFSIFSLPNLLILLDPKPSPSFRSWEQSEASRLGRGLAHIGSVSARHYGVVLTVFFGSLVLVAFGASRLQIDRAQIDNFAPDEPIRIADQTINDSFAGSAFLDVIVQTDEPEGLLDSRRMEKIRELQRVFEGLPYVQKTVSIVDYLALLHAAIDERSPSSVAARELPQSGDAIAQYLLVYESSGDPTDFEEEIDTEYSTALIRGVLNEQHFSLNRETVAALKQYIDSEFNEPGMTALLTGDVNVSYHWMRSLQHSHFSGVLVSLALVLITSILVFRSVSTSIVAAVPVSFTVLLLYAAMATFGIYLEPATSMFAAIAIGVGIDFAIHLADRLREALALHDEDIHLAVDHALPLTARACFFNSGALALGFAVLLTSELSMLQRFGGLVTLASIASFLLALVIVPAMFAAGRAINEELFRPSRQAAGGAVLVAIVLSIGLFWSEQGVSAGAEIRDGNEVAARIAQRAEGDASRRVISIEIKDRRGKTREREALILKRHDDDSRITRFTYLSPKSVKGVTFLSQDRLTSDENDERWLFLPATRKVRRIPASDRGDYFLGTDFTYEDIQSELKLSLDDFDFVLDSAKASASGTVYRLSGTPKNDTIARELGYGGFRAEVDGSTWLFNWVEFVDVAQKRLKTVTINEVGVFDGIWFATDIEAVNHQTAHETRFLYRDVEFMADLPDTLFDATTLSRGLPSRYTP